MNFLMFWISYWEAAKEHLSLIWLAWLIPQLFVITRVLSTLDLLQSPSF